MGRQPPRSSPTPSKADGTVFRHSSDLSRWTLESLSSTASTNSTRGPFELFEHPREAGTDSRTTVCTVDNREMITASHGLSIAVSATLADLDPDLLVVLGGQWVTRGETGTWAEAERGTIPEAITRLHDEGVDVGGVCTDGMLLARRGSPTASPTGWPTTPATQWSTNERLSRIASRSGRRRCGRVYSRLGRCPSVDWRRTERWASRHGSVVCSIPPTAGFSGGSIDDSQPHPRKRALRAVAFRCDRLG